MSLLLTKELRKKIRGEVRDDPHTLEEYSRDTSLFEITPRYVISPHDALDIQHLVSFVNSYNKKIKNDEDRLTITARSGGTDMTGGPLNESIILDFTAHMNRMIEVGTDSAIAQPGIYYRDFEVKTLQYDLILPSYPASRDICALGGMVANNAGGEKTLAYGKTADYVKHLKVILADGKEYLIKPLNDAELAKKLKKKGFEGDVYRETHRLLARHKKAIANAKPRVSKNSSGYALWDVWDGTTFDLTRIFTGSQGTLGIITEIGVRLVHPKKYSSLLIVFLNDTKNLALITNKLLHFTPESLESFDNHTLRLGMRYFFWSFALQFMPEAWLIARNAFHLPKMIVLAEFTGDSPSEVMAQARSAQESLHDFHVATRIAHSKKDVLKYWKVRRESFNLLRQRIHDKQTAPFIDDIIIDPKDMPSFLPELEAIIGKYDIISTTVGHLGNGNFHIIPLMDLAHKHQRDIIPKLAQEVYDLVIRYKGSITAEHNDGLIRTPFLQQMYGEKICALFSEIKQIFDPNTIFNPGKKVGGSLDYTFSHLKKH